MQGEEAPGAGTCASHQTPARSCAAGNARCARRAPPSPPSTPWAPAVRRPTPLLGATAVRIGAVRGLHAKTADAQRDAATERLKSVNRKDVIRRLPACPRGPKPSPADSFKGPYGPRADELGRGAAAESSGREAGAAGDGARWRYPAELAPRSARRRPAACRGKQAAHPRQPEPPAPPLPCPAAPYLHRQG